MKRKRWKYLDGSVCKKGLQIQEYAGQSKMHKDF